MRKHHVQGAGLRRGWWRSLWVEAEKTRQAIEFEATENVFIEIHGRRYFVTVIMKHFGTCSSIRSLSYNFAAYF